MNEERNNKQRSKFKIVCTHRLYCVGRVAFCVLSSLFFSLHLSAIVNIFTRIKRRYLYFFGNSLFCFAPPTKSPFKASIFSISCCCCLCVCVCFNPCEHTGFSFPFDKDTQDNSDPPNQAYNCSNLD